jgi:3'(2'), 5'-bisphosphate nucleotidase/inositol polyphosphate 1-phosphatase
MRGLGLTQSVCVLLQPQDGEVVLGVLGCPNLPQGAVGDDDGGAGAGP